ncbi:MAG: class I SAM-dependent methyltransferase [Methylocella sp.]
MAQNIYDQTDFYEGYSQLPRSVHGLDGAAEWPAIRALLPEFAGKRVVDLGCGFGWFCRWAAKRGAQSVLGLDLSENMLAQARRDTDSPIVSYEIADLDTLVLPAGSFGFAYSSLTFHYVSDFRRLTKDVYNSLVSGSRFVFTIEHPIYMAPAHPGWMVDEHGQKTWPVDGYSVEGERRTDWLAKGVVKHHRTIGTTLNTLIDIGFVVDRVIEWRPTPEQIRQQPDLDAEKERPMILIVSVHR